MNVKLQLSARDFLWSRAKADMKASSFTTGTDDRIFGATMVGFDTCSANTLMLPSCLNQFKTLEFPWQDDPNCALTGVCEPPYPPGAGLRDQPFFFTAATTALLLLPSIARSFPKKSVELISQFHNQLC
jgi:hypothetical protein